MSSLATDPNDHHLLLDTLVAGGFAGLITDTLTFPFDSMKFARHMGFKIDYKMLRKGLLPSILGSAPTSASFLFTYNAIKHYCKTLVDEKNFYLVHLFAAASAEVVSTTVRMPFDNVKKRQQILSNFVPSKQIALRIKRKAGLSAFFTGYNELLLSRLHSSVITFPVWEILIAEMKVYKNKTELFPHETAACGAMAGGFVGMLTNPLDVARSHLIREEIKRVEYARVRYYAEQWMQSKAQTDALTLKAEQEKEKARLLQLQASITVAKPVRVTQMYAERKVATSMEPRRFVVAADHTSRLTKGVATTLINKDSDKYATIQVNLAAQINSRTEVAMVDKDSGKNVVGKSNSASGVNLKRPTLTDVKIKVTDLKVKLKEMQPEKMWFVVKHLPVIYQTVEQIYNEKGMKGLMAGVFMRTCRITMGGWLFFYTYASTMHFLDVEDEIEKVEQWVVDAEEMLIEKIQHVIQGEEEDLQTRQTKERLQKNRYKKDKKE